VIEAPHAALGAARTLALSRVVAGLVIVTSADVHGAARFAGVPDLLVSPPPDLGWLRAFDLSFTQATALTWTVVVAALLGALGAYARMAFGVAASGLFVLLALSHRMGAVIHSHHLLWAAALLAASPCADVWSIDAHFEPRALRPRAAYAAPLVAFRALVACIYFFPGLYKLISFASGTEPGAWLRSHLAWKWLQHGAAPALLSDLAPTWFGPLALAALAFELSMPVLVAFRRTRPLALLGAIAFHLGTALLLFIRFDSLAAVLTSLLDLAPAERERASLRDTVRGALRPTLWVGGVLVTGAFASGVAGATQLYPFACYPTFADAAPATMPSARVILTQAGTSCALPRPSDSTEWIAAFRIAGAYADALSSERAQAYLQRVLRAKLRASRCNPSSQTRVALVLEDLAWDFPARSARVVKQRVAYSAAASALGIAPAEGNKASSSPSR
jgi:hypothetical protein